MANLKVSLKIRVTAGGVRSWVPATGRSIDPKGPFYLCWCEGSTPKFKKAGDTYEEAQAGQIRQERRLLAASQGFVLPSEPSEGTKTHSLRDTLKHYLKLLSRPDNNNEYRPDKSLQSTESEINWFIEWCPKKNVEDIDRDLLIAFRQHLYAEGYAKDTVRNKLGIVMSFLKHNGLVPYTRILQKRDWPSKKKTVPDPYSNEEIFAMLNVANEDEHLLIRFMVATGMREAEVSVAERRDIVDGGIQVQPKKPQYDGWRAKNPSAVRTIDLDEEIIPYLLARPEGLLFPRADGYRNQHILRIIERLATAAGVAPTVGKSTQPEAIRNDWCHRMRDTWFTHQVEDAADVQNLREICVMGGHKNLETIDVYVALRDAKNPKRRARAKKANRFAVPKFNSQKVVSIAS